MKRMMLLIPALLIATPAMAAKEVSVQPKFTPTSGTLDLTWPGNVSCRTEQGGSDVVIRCNQPMKVANIKAIAAQSAGWIDSASASYDTLLLHLAKPAKVNYGSKGNKVRVEFLPAPKVAPVSNDPEGKKRVKLLRARVLREEGKHEDAARALDELKAEYPNDSMILAEEAQNDLGRGKWRRAYGILEEAKRLEPENELLHQATSDIYRQNAPRAKIDAEWRRTEGSATELFLRGETYRYVKHGLRAGAVLEADHVDAKGIRNADGRVRSASVVRPRGELYLQQDLENGHVAKGSFYAGYKTVGLGGNYSMPNPLGRTTLVGELRRPNWDFVEGVVVGAARDRIGLYHDFDLRTDIDFSAGGYFNHYVYDWDQEAGTTASANASLGYPVITGRERLSLLYALDAEYRLNEEERFGPAGGIYTPLGLRSREVHFFYGLFGYDFNPRLSGEAYGGYAVDRLGGDGPIAGVRLNGDYSEDMSWQLRASRSIRLDSSGDNVNSVGGYWLWIF